MVYYIFIHRVCSSRYRHRTVGGVVVKLGNWGKIADRFLELIYQNVLPNN